MEYIVSVIVPIYNVAPYIKKSLESLFNQNLHHGIEFVLVNDASTDNSLELISSLLESYPERRPHVKIINNNENKGLVASRLIGLHASTGKYILQCDSDDWIDEGLCQQMITIAEETDADIVGCDIIDEFENKSSLRIQHFYSGETLIEQLLAGNPHYAGSLCNRLVRRDFYIENRPNIPYNFSMFEDLIISLALHLKTQKIEKNNDGKYHYRHRAGSITTTITHSYVESMIKSAKYIQTIINDHIENNSPSNHTKLNQSLDIFLQKAKLPYIYNLEVYDSKKWRKIFPNLPLYLKGIGVLPYISIMLEKFHLSFFNKLIIRLRYAIRR